ncbi:unnamed protein product [Amoebophrya sp. A25]|nr:unnamed protein product [Amoebophrya sp. A25]|eukprot:GSA25T00004530001.1
MYNAYRDSRVTVMVVQPLSALSTKMIVLHSNAPKIIGGRIRDMTLSKEFVI